MAEVESRDFGPPLELRARPAHLLPENTIVAVFRQALEIRQWFWKESGISEPHGIEKLGCAMRALGADIFRITYKCIYLDSAIEATG